MKTILLIFASLTLLKSQTPVTGTVTGTLNDEKSKPVSNGYVLLSVIPAPAPALTKPVHLLAITGKDGKFQFDNVPSGDYRVCSQVPGSRLVNPCNWNLKLPTVTVKGKDIVDTGVIALEEGYLLEVDIKDTQGLLQQNKRKNQDAVLAFAIRTPTQFHIMTNTPGKPEDSQYSFVVPYDLDLELITTVSLYTVSDDDNLSVAKGNGLARKLKFSKGDPPKSVKISVNGLSAR